MSYYLLQKKEVLPDMSFLKITVGNMDCMRRGQPAMMMMMSMMMIYKAAKEYKVEIKPKKRLYMYNCTWPQLYIVVH